MTYSRTDSGRRVNACLCLFLLAFFLSAAGCATRMSTRISSPFAGGAGNGEEVQKHVDAVLRTIEERNATVESQPDWRSRAYQKFMIKDLDSIDEGEYEGYARYLDNGSAYIVVHPAYYTFFNDDSLSSENSPGVTGENALERFLSEGAYTSKSRLIKAQEKQIRDFLEYMSTDKKLVILILPYDYRDFPAYKYKKEKDEYMRFINEVTNGSDSVIYLYSKSPNRGTLTEKNRRELLKFLYAIKTKQILLGGGYVGRCIEDFYKDIEQYYSYEKLYLVPEITAISPADVSSGTASDMLKSDGTIDVGKLSADIRGNAVGNQEVIPRIKNLSPPYAAP